MSSLKTSDLKAILHVFDKQGFTDAHFTEKSELQKLVSEIVSSSTDLSEKLAQALAFKKHPLDEPVPMDIDEEPPTKKRRRTKTFYYINITIIYSLYNKNYINNLTYLSLNVIKIYNRIKTFSMLLMRIKILC